MEKLTDLQLGALDRDFPLALRIGKLHLGPLPHLIPSLWTDPTLFLRFRFIVILLQSLHFRIMTIFNRSSCLPSLALTPSGGPCMTEPVFLPACAAHIELEPDWNECFV